MKYLYENDGIIFAECEECKRTLKFKEYQISEVKDGIECFCGSISDCITGIPKKQYSNSSSQSGIITVYQENHTPVLRCPTCGSTNVKKISLTSKAVGGAMFGLFSSNIRNTFRCEQCGYKW